MLQRVGKHVADLYRDSPLSPSLHHPEGHLLVARVTANQCVKSCEQAQGVCINMLKEK